MRKGYADGGDSQIQICVIEKLRRIFKIPKSAGGPAQSKTLRANSMRTVNAPASWTAVALYRFSTGERKSLPKTEAIRKSSLTITKTAAKTPERNRGESPAPPAGLAQTSWPVEP